MTLVDIAGWVNVELAKNVAEIGIVRHLHAAREGSIDSGGRADG